MASRLRWTVGTIAAGSVFDLGYRYVVIGGDGKTTLGHYKTEQEAEAALERMKAGHGGAGGPTK